EHSLAKDIAVSQRLGEHFPLHLLPCHTFQRSHAHFKFLQVTCTKACDPRRPRHLLTEKRNGCVHLLAMRGVCKAHR
ncbi:hypothetical protein BC826DRAFT_1016245, partial [Russula brevipes]